MKMVKLEDIEKILYGIDKDEIENDRGWWENSSGAKFGEEKLEEIRRLFEVN